MTDLTTAVRAALEAGGVLPHRYRILPAAPEGDAYNREAVVITDTYLICRQPLQDAAFRGAPFEVDPSGLYSVRVIAKEAS